MDGARDGVAPLEALIGAVPVEPARPGVLLIGTFVPVPGRPETGLGPGSGGASQPIENMPLSTMVPMVRIFRIAVFLVKNPDLPSRLLLRTKRLGLLNLSPAQ